jgi:hypothetical protein
MKTENKKFFLTCKFDEEWKGNKLGQFLAKFMKEEYNKR